MESYGRLASPGRRAEGPPPVQRPGESQLRSESESAAGQADTVTHRWFMVRMSTSPKTQRSSMFNHGLDNLGNLNTTRSTNFFRYNVMGDFLA